MPRESLPGGMNRRGFFTTVGATGIALATEGRVQAQEGPTLDNHLELITESAIWGKVDFPDWFKPMDQETKEMILAIQTFQIVLLGDAQLSEDMRKGISQEAPFIGDVQAVEASKKTIWEQLKKAGIATGDYSSDSFYNSLLLKLPSHLAQYGIFIYPQFITVDVNKKITHAEVSIAFSKVDRTVREDTNQLGIPLHRDVLHISDLSTSEGWLPTNQPPRTAQAIFGNIAVSDADLKFQSDVETNALRDLQAKINAIPAFTLADHERNGLRRNDSWLTAADIVTPEIVRRIKFPLLYEDFEFETIEHETRHLVDAQLLDFRKFLPFIRSTNSEEISRTGMNFGVHREINPLLIQLISSRDKAWTLLRFINASRSSNTMGVHGIANKWILRKMTELISKEPEKYGITIDDQTKAGRANQIFSQIDMLLDKPDLVNGLCSEIIEIHNTNLAEDIVGNQDYLTTGILLHPDASGLNKVFEIGIPATVIGVGALALEALRRRKKKVAETQVSRAERRAKKRADKSRSAKTLRRN